MLQLTRDPKTFKGTWNFLRFPNEIKNIYLSIFTKSKKDAFIEFNEKEALITLFTFRPVLRMDSIDEAMIFAAGFEKNATIDQKNTKTTVKDKW